MPGGVASHPYAMQEMQAADSAPTTIRESSPHFEDGKFFNPGVPDHNFRQLFRWIRTRKIGPWRTWIPSEPGPAPPARVHGADLRVTFINHATFLLQTSGLNILTDPVWSLRASPV